MQRTTLRYKFTRLIVAVGLVFYLSAGGLGIALADISPTPEPSVSPTPVESLAPVTETTQSPSSEPEVSPSPSMSPDIAPEPSTLLVSPETTQSPEATPGAEPTIAPVIESTEKVGSETSQISGEDTTGPGKCTGTIPSWVFDVATKKWLASDKTSFVCSMPSGYYLSPKYHYNTQSGWYVILPPEAPVGSLYITAPNVIHTVLGDITVGSQDYQMAEALGLLKHGSDGILISPGMNSVSSSGSGGAATTNISSNGQTWLDLTNLVTVINALDSVSKSGDVTGASNTTVGNLSSGTASVIANLINLLAAAWSWANGDLSFFMQNFFGNQSGNVLLNPTQEVTGSGGQLGATTTNSNALNVNAKSSGAIVNNLDLNAQSGDVAADSNTAVGNVASGEAMASVNILNLISTLINSGNSFFGIINIFGSLTGNILFPSGFFDGLIPSTSTPVLSAGASGPGSVNDTSIQNTNTANIRNTVLNSVDNNITTTAASGSVGAGSNTNVGSVASGLASTTQSLFNMANTSLFGDNAVLVIVNVLGHWVGKIMTLPGGSTTSALLTSNAQTDQISTPTAATGPNSQLASTSTNTNTANIDQAAIGTITNNVNVGAESGSALATRNTSVGDVSSGKASAASSVANIFNSVLNVRHWFGVLIINVFGDWAGNVDTASTQVSVPVLVLQANQAVTAPGVAELYTNQLPTITASRPLNSGAVVAGSSDVVATPHMVLAAAQQTAGETEARTKANNMNFLFALSALVMMLAGALFSAERKLSSGSGR